jgi:signal transduction histidine kinase
MSQPHVADQAPGPRAGSRLRRLLGFRSIRAKISFYLLAVSVVPILFLSYVAFGSVKGGIREELLRHLGGAVSLKRDSIDQWYKERAMQSSRISRIPVLAHQAAVMAEVEFESRAAHPAYVAMRDHLRLYTEEKGFYDEVFLMDMRGRVILSTDPAQEGKFKDNRPYFQEGRKDLYIQNTYHSVTLGRTTSTIALPIRRDGRALAVLAFRLRIHRLHEIIHSYAGLGPESDMYLVNNYNYFVTDPAGKPGFAMERVNYSEPVRRCLPGEGTTAGYEAGQTGADELVSYDGRQVLAAFTYLPEYRLCIVAELATDTAYQPVRAMQYFMMIVTASTLTAVMLIAFFLSASISRPILELDAVAARAASGDMDQQIDLGLRDELGTLARSFDTMLANLRERTQALARSNADLERSNVDLEEFGYAVSHDLKEPLRSVSGFLELLKRRAGAKLDDKANDYIDRSLAGAERMRVLIEDLLAYARVSTGPRSLQAVDLNQVLREVLGGLEQSIEESGARIDVGELPVLQAERAQLSALFQNLIANAIKFRREQPVIRIGAREEDGEWQFSVEDNGIGIDAEQFERVFQVFQRLHGKDEYPGTGIGLAVCKKIVERHGGRIWLESAPGVGTTFHFTIPAQPPGADTDGKTDAPAGAAA